jgi:hypothetical protein
MNMSPKALILTMWCALLAAPAVHAQESDAAAGHEPARVRFFGRAVLDMKFYPASACVGGRSVVVSRSGLKGGLGSKENLSLGIPETPDLINMEERDGFFSKAFYREYAVDGGRPMAIQGAEEQTTGARRSRSSFSCGPIGGVFVPESGKDYEVAFNYGDGMCRVDVAQIDSSEGDIKLVPVALAPLLPCPAAAGKP